MFNSFVGVGNLTKDPDVKFLPSGDKVATLSIAFNKKFKNKNNEPVEKVCFLDGRIFGKFVESVEKYLHKGDRILVQGELEQEHWFAENGEKRSKHVLSLSSIKFLSAKKDVESHESEAMEKLNEEVDMSFVGEK